jgi:hypothetical protein
VPETGGFDAVHVEHGSYSSSGGPPGRSHLQQHLQASLEVAPRSHSASASVNSPSHGQRQAGDPGSARARPLGSSAFDRVAAAAAGSSPTTSMGGAMGGGSTGGSPLAGQSPRHGAPAGSNSASAAAAALFSSISGGSPAAAARKRRVSGEERAAAVGLGVGEGSSSLSGMGSLPPIPSADD